MSELKHLAIIMDGNGRWAQSHNKPRREGHKAGASVVREITTWCAKHTIEYLTLYAFSTENWKRPKAEVDFLMKLLRQYLKNEKKTYLENNIRFKAIGDISSFSNPLKEMIFDLEESTQNNTNLTQILALNYGSRNEIARCFQKLLRASREGNGASGGSENLRGEKPSNENLAGLTEGFDGDFAGELGSGLAVGLMGGSPMRNGAGGSAEGKNSKGDGFCVGDTWGALEGDTARLEQAISVHLDTHFAPDVDLLIRTGGEMRISNFLLWQISYAELHFTQTFWPDFTTRELENIIAEFRTKSRRFGGL